MTASLDAPITWFDVEPALLRFDPATKVVSVFRTKGSLRDRILFQKPADVVLNIETAEERIQRQSLRIEEGFSTLKKLQSYESHAVAAVSTKDDVGCFSHWSSSEPRTKSTLVAAASGDDSEPVLPDVPIVKYFLHTHCGSKLKTLVFHSRGATSTERLQTRAVVSEILRRVYVEGPKKLVAFVSPVSGSGHAQKMWEDDVLPILYMSRHQIRVITTQRQGHLEDTIADGSANLGSDHVVIAIGGDGMVHEAVNGIMRRRDVLLQSNGVDPVDVDKLLPLVATIPAGSGCALAKCFNILEPIESARAIVHLNTTVMDLLHVTFVPCKHHFVPSDDEIAAAKKRKQPVPVERDEMTQYEGRPRYAFLNCAFAITNEIDKGSEKWRWMGNARFTVKAMQLLAKGVPLYRCKVRYLPWADAVSGEGIAKICDEHKIDTKSYPKCTARDTCTHCLQNRGELGAPPATETSSSTPTTSATEWLELPEDRFALLMLMNIVHAARDMAIAPLAHVGDGAIDIVYTGKRPGEGGDLARADFIKVFLNLESGEHVEVPGIRYVKAREVEVLPEDGLVMADGELLPISGVRVKTVSKAVRIVRSL